MRGDRHDRGIKHCEERRFVIMTKAEADPPHLGWNLMRLEDLVLSSVNKRNRAVFGVADCSQAVPVWAPG